MRAIPLAIALLTLPAPLFADAVTDALTAASTAYAADDLRGTADQIALASEALRLRQTELLNAFLPEPPDGFTREIDPEYSVGFAMIGGGAGTEARYSNGETSFSITIMADNMMVTSMVGMLGDVEMMSVVGNMVEANGAALLDTDGSIAGLVNDRVLVTAEGAETDVMMPLMQSIDYTALGTYDAP